MSNKRPLNSKAAHLTCIPKCRRRRWLLAFWRNETRRNAASENWKKWRQRQSEYAKAATIEMNWRFRRGIRGWRMQIRVTAQVCYCRRFKCLCSSLFCPSVGLSHFNASRRSWFSSCSRKVPIWKGWIEMAESEKLFGPFFTPLYFFFAELCRMLFNLFRPYPARVAAYIFVPLSTW